MKKLLLTLLMPALAGCLTSRPPSVAYWLVAGEPEHVAKLAAKYPSVRVSQVLLRAPYETPSLAVLRADGTVAFDAYNRFAASPSALLKGPTADLVRASGLFAEVVGPTSAAHAPCTLEADFTRWALDCTGESPRVVAEVRLTLVDTASRAVTAYAVGAASADAARGDYAAAFSEALSAALSAALKKL